jgi:hypothetical protein
VDAPDAVEILRRRLISVIEYELDQYDILRRQGTPGRIERLRQIARALRELEGPARSQ